jgi:hypothetical protein
MRNQDAKRKRIERKLASLVASIEPALVSLDKHDSNRVLHDTERIIRPENMKTSSTAVNGRIHQLQIGEARDALAHALEIKSHQGRAAANRLSPQQIKYANEELRSFVCVAGSWYSANADAGADLAASSPGMLSLWPRQLS